MKGKSDKKRLAAVAFAAAMIAVLAVGTVALTGCGSGGGGSTSTEPEKIINPLTGLECSEALPARPIQVSIPIDNYGALPQSNISKADLIYELPAEGQMTRMQAIFYSEFPDFVGPVRSIRPYFVDVSAEYKAIHVGYGWGKHARSQMELNNVHYINGMDSGDNPMFYRDENRSAPDNAYIKFSSILDKANEEGWMDKTQTIKPFKFRDAEWKAAQKEAKAEAKDTIKKLQDSDDPDDVKAVEAAKALVAEPEKSSTIKVSSNGTVGGFDYDSETKQYAHTQYNEPMIDKETGEQLKVDNVIVQRVHSDIMVDAETGTSDEKGRLEIDMYAGGDAMLFTQGQVVKGSWTRKNSSSRTIFRDENGEQFRLTPGHTWVLVLDQNYDLEY